MRIGREAFLATPPRLSYSAAVDAPPMPPIVRLLTVVVERASGGRSG